MGSYDHGLQVNKISGGERSVEVSLAIPSPARKMAPPGISLENVSRPMKFLQRVVKSLMRQMNVQSHTFGPGEAITIDLQAEIKYDDYVILNKFLNSENYEDADKYLGNVDDTMSNLLHVVEHSASKYDYLDFIFKLPIFCSLKFWLVMISVGVISFLIIMLSYRAVYAPNNVSMLLYGFLIIFILSCIWTFSYMYEDAKATNYAKLMQAQSPPPDCEYENLGLRDSISYFFRVQLFGYKDRCEAYYSTTMTDPFWSVNPLEAISKSFSVLIFAPFGYIGDKLGLFFGGIISGIPFWLQPLLVLLIFGFIFLSLFGYRVVSPLFTIEPARRSYLEGGSHACGAPQNPALMAERNRHELIERPEHKLMKSMRDAGTDMDGFENYLNGIDETEVRPSSIYPIWLLFIWEGAVKCWRLLLWILDTLFRQTPPPSNESFDEDDNSFNFAHNRDHNHPRNDHMEMPVPEPDPPRRQIQMEDIVIPRRRMHINLEKSGTEETRDNKENLAPSQCSSSTMKRSASTGRLFYEIGGPRPKSD